MAWVRKFHCGLGKARVNTRTLKRAHVESQEEQRYGWLAWFPRSQSGEKKERGTKHLATEVLPQAVLEPSVSAGSTMPSLFPVITTADVEPPRQMFRPAAASTSRADSFSHWGGSHSQQRRKKPCLPHSLWILENSWQTD